MSVGHGPAVATGEDLLSQPKVPPPVSLAVNDTDHRFSVVCASAGADQRCTPASARASRPILAARRKNEAGRAEGRASGPAWGWKDRGSHGRTASAPATAACRRRVPAVGSRRLDGGAAPGESVGRGSDCAPRGAEGRELGGQLRLRRYSRLGSARLGSARLGSARLGSARLGSARLGSARLGSARLGSARLGSARLGSARLGSARLGSARLGSARLGSARLGSAIYYSTARHDPRQNAGINQPPNAACQGDAPHPLSAGAVRRPIAHTLHSLLTVNEGHLFTPAGRADVLLFSGRFSRSRTHPPGTPPRGCRDRSSFRALGGGTTREPAERLRAIVPVGVKNSRWFIFRP